MSEGVCETVARNVHCQIAVLLDSELKNMWRGLIWGTWRKTSENVLPPGRDVTSHHVKHDSYALEPDIQRTVRPVSRSFV